MEVSEWEAREEEEIREGGPRDGAHRQPQVYCTPASSDMHCCPLSTHQKFLNSSELSAFKA